MKDTLVVGLILALILFVYYLTLPAAGQGSQFIQESMSAVTFIAIFIAGAALFLWRHQVDLNEKVVVTRPTLTAIIAAVFLFISMFYLVGGIRDAISEPHYEAGKTFTQQYSWVIQFVFYSAVGTVLVYLSGRMKRTQGANEAQRTPAQPIGIFLVACGLCLCLALLLVYGLVGRIEVKDMGKYIEGLRAPFELLNVAAIAYFFMWTVERTIVGEGLTPESLATPVSALGVVLMLVSIGVYLFAIFGYVYSHYTMSVVLISLTGSVVLGFTGLIFMAVSNALHRREGMESNLLSTSMFVFGGVDIVLAIVIFIAGFDEYLRSAAPETNWLLAVVLFLIPGVLIEILVAPYLRNMEKGYRSTPAVEVRRKGRKRA